MLQRSVDTIVNQVQAMKTLVNEFRDYARLPASQLLPLDLNALVGEVLGLYAAAQETGRLHAELGAALPAIVGDGTQLRQVIHNLVQNALDAVAERPDGRVRVCTEAVSNEQGEVRAVRLLVARQRPGLLGQGAQARLRALRHDQVQGHRPRPRGGQEDRRRARRARAHRQPRRERRRRVGYRVGERCARCASFAIIFETRPGAAVAPRRPG